MNAPINSYASETVASTGDIPNINAPIAADTTTAFLIHPFL